MRDVNDSTANAKVRLQARLYHTSATMCDVQLQNVLCINIEIYV